MNRSTGPKNGRPKPTVALVNEALQQAAQDAVEAHRQAGQPLVAWENGRAVLLSPESLESTNQPPKPRRRRSS